jgi:hypothetical protein
MGSTGSQCNLSRHYITVLLEYYDNNYYNSRTHVLVRLLYIGVRVNYGSGTQRAYAGI